MILSTMPAMKITRVGISPFATTAVTVRRNEMSYLDYLPEDGRFTEEELWEAIAESKGIDVNEIMDGDLVEWL